MQEGHVDVIEAERVQDGGVNVVHVGSACRCAQPDLVRCADHLAALDAAAGHPDGEAPRVVIAALALLVEGRASELSAPDDERSSSSPRAFRSASSPRDGLSDDLHIFDVIAFDVVVRVPAAAAAASRVR